MWISEENLLSIYAIVAIICGLLLVYVVHQTAHDKTIVNNDPKWLQWLRHIFFYLASAVAFWSVIYYTWNVYKLSLPIVAMIGCADLILFTNAVSLHLRQPPHKRNYKKTIKIYDHYEKFKPMTTFRDRDNNL
jgi:CRISPR/Cas system-associated protein Csm6